MCSRNGEPLLVILDLRTETQLKPRRPLPIIKVQCPIVFCLLDDLIKPEIRRQIPTDRLVVTVTETGNRDKFAMQYLSRFGYRNIKGLLFGMRGWIKQDYPVEKTAVDTSHEN